MKICRIGIKNYRTLEDINIKFPFYYSAICGKNDSGKTNVARVVRCLMRDEDPFFSGRHEVEVEFKNDFTKWVEPNSNSKITFILELGIHQDRDVALYQFIEQYLKIESGQEVLDVKISVTYKEEISQPVVEVGIREKIYTGDQAEEILRRIHNSNSIFCHDSTAPTFLFRYPNDYGGLLRELSPEYHVIKDNLSKTIEKQFKQLAKEPQKKISELLGRLNEKYKVGLSVPKLDLEYLPLNITLGDKKIDVPLGGWGSGTINRTLILLTLFKARQVSRAEKNTNKITPIILIEEPESFLHPSAQAQFGQVLQDLCEEFKVQVIVTTHSPYLLSHENQEGNILLDREIVSNQQRQTKSIDTTGDNWMEPFVLALGISSEELSPWRNLFFSSSECILLVEGDQDKDYFELLRDKAHGDNCLDFDGEVYSYGGAGNLSNNSLLNFLKDRYKKIFITFDLDVVATVEPKLKNLNFKKNKNYLPIGKGDTGKGNIEGLLPDSIKSKVHVENAKLVDAALNGSGEKRKSARNTLKKKYLEKFKEVADYTEVYYGNFYPIVKAINNAFK